MTRDELLRYHSEICRSAQELMALKNRDYAGQEGNEPFANFTRVESMGICSTEQGFMTRVTDKMSRLSSFLNFIWQFCRGINKTVLSGYVGFVGEVQMTI